MYILFQTLFHYRLWQDILYGLLCCKVVQLLSRVQPFASSWSTARQASLSFTISWSLPKLMSILSSVVPFSSCLQSVPASGSFPMSQQFASGSQSIGASDSASVLPMNIQDWFPLGLTGWISLQSKGLSRVFSNTTVQKHQFFDSQPSLRSSSHIHTWLLKKWKTTGKTKVWLYGPLLTK